MDFVSQIVKVERKKMEEKIVNVKSKSLVGLKEKLLCLSIDEVCKHALVLDSIVLNLAMQLEISYSVVPPCKVNKVFLGSIR